MLPPSRRRCGFLLAAAIVLPRLGAAQALPPVECVEALRGARLTALAGYGADAARKAQEALALPACELPGLVALLDLVRQGAPVSDVPALRARLVARLEDPAAAVPRGTLTFLVHQKTTKEDDERFLAALDARRSRAEAGATPLAHEELAELLTVSVELEQRLQRREEARATIDRLLALGDSVEWRWRALLLDLDLQRWESAEQLLERMRGGGEASEFLDRLHVLALAHLGRWEEMQREVDQLVLAASAGGVAESPALAGAPGLPDESLVALLLDAGWALRDAGRDAEAEGLFRRVLTLAPDNPEAHRVLLYFYATPEERAAHEAAVAEHLARLDAPDALYQEGTEMLAAGDAAGALDLLARAAPALEGTAFADAAWYNLGLAAFKLERWQEASDAFARAARLDDRRAETQFRWGVALVRLGRCADAVPPLRRALELDPGKAQAHYFLGRCYADLGLKDAAAREQELYRTAAPPR